MHARELIDLAAFLAAQGPVFVSGMQQPPDTALVQYWTASKCRLDRWGRTLSKFHRDLPPDSGRVETACSQVRWVCEEIIIGEMLTRIWSCILCWLGSATGNNEAPSVAASVLAGQIEISNRALGLISAEQGVVAPVAAELDRLRRRSQRWTDFLLASMGPHCNASGFAHDAARAQEFAEDFDRPQTPAVQLQIWGLVTASLRAAFAQQPHGITANADLNGQIAGSILACFPVEAFDSSGMYHPLWLLRLSATASDTQMLVESLLAADSSNECPAPFVLRRLNSNDSA